MISEQISGELMSLVSAVVASFLTWITTRKRQKAENKRIEVDVWEKTLDVIQQKVVAPLSERIDSLQRENEKVIKQLNNLKNAINKMYNCRHLVNCPIRDELQKQQTGRGGTYINRANRANRQRAPTNEDNGEAGFDSPIDGENEFEPP